MNQKASAISTAQVQAAVDGLERLKETLEVLRHPVVGKIKELHEDDVDKAILAIKTAYGLN